MKPPFTRPRLVDAEAAMDSRRNLVCILLCLVCGFSRGDLGWPLLNMDLLDEDIREEVDQALQMMTRPSFQGWSLELIKQAAPRTHVALVELWLQFRKLQKVQDETWRKMKRMMRMTSASCRELNDKVRDVTVQVPERLGAMEKRVEIIDARMKNMAHAHKAELANGTQNTEDHREENEKVSERLPKGACHQEPCAISAPGTGRRKVSSTQLAHKVAALTELLNGHNELLVELYQRMTELEGGTRGAKVTAQDGSGDGQ